MLLLHSFWLAGKLSSLVLWQFYCSVEAETKVSPQKLTLTAYQQLLSFA